MTEIRKIDGLEFVCGESDDVLRVVVSFPEGLPTHRIEEINQILSSTAEEIINVLESK